MTGWHIASTAPKRRPCPHNTCAPSAFACSHAGLACLPTSPEPGGRPGI